MTMHVSQANVLRDAKALIDTPAKHLKDAFWSSSGARCASSAVAIAINPELHDQMGISHHIAYMADHPAFKALAEAAPPDLGAVEYFAKLGEIIGTICHANNTLSHEGLMAMFDRAIANEEARVLQ